MKRVCALLMVLLAVWLPATVAHAHALEPGYLEIEPLAPDEWRLTWRKPQVRGAPMGIEAVLPEGCNPRRPPPPRFDGRAFVSGWVARCDTPLSDGVVFIDGLADTATDVLVRYKAEPGASSQTFRLTPDTSSVALPAVPTPWGVFVSYLGLGVDHILGGIDHLLFVFALLLLIKGTARLLWAITAFTVAHSITLAAAALEVVSLPMPPVEAAIALSIMFLAAEILRPSDAPPTLMQRAPWTVAFAFGLLHGMGFASALREIGLPEGDIPLALLSFNLGVEAGQILFVLVVLALAQALRRLVPELFARQSVPGSAGLTCAAYAIGALAAFWTMERVVGFWV